MRNYLKFSIFFTITIFACGRISLTGIHPVASSIVDTGIIYGSKGSIIGDEDVGLYPSIALDTEENPVISYYDATNSRLKFASWNRRENRWDLGVVDDSGDVGSFTSMIVLSNGTIFISYYDRTNGDLKIAKRIKDVWDVRVFDRGGPANYNVGKFGSLALSPDGNLCISYFDESNGDLMYSCWDGVTLDGDGNPLINAEAVDAYPESIGGETGLYTSLKFSPSGPVIAYYDASNGNPKVAFKTDTGWSKLTVGEKLRSVPLSVDPATHKTTISPPSTFIYSEITVYKNSTPLEPGIGFTLDSPGQITIIDYDPSAIYTADYVTSPDQDGTWIDLALRSDGVPCVAFHNDTGGTLMYGCLEQGTKEWDLEVVDSGNVGTDISLVLTNADAPVITYFDNAYMDLKLAFKRGKEWVTETIDTPGVTGLWTSSVLDADGFLHIAYYRTLGANAGDLKYIKMLLSR